MLCYPAHTTHILQGLDVVIFATMKLYLSDKWDKWEQETGQKISKMNFLAIYGLAHLCTLTAKNIKAAFQKAGVWPFNPNVISTEMMVPSKETSCKGHLPIVPTTPVQVVVKMLQHMTLSDQSHESDDEDAEAADESDSGSIEDSDEEEGGDEDSNSNSDGDGDKGGESLDAINNVRKALSGGALAALVLSKPITLDTQVHHNIAHTIPAVTRPSETLKIILKTTNEEFLLTAL